AWRCSTRRRRWRCCSAGSTSTKRHEAERATKTMMERTPASSLSASSLVSELDEQELAELIRPLTKVKARKLRYLWEFWDPHKGQIPPLGDWRVWLLLAGRGFGKTRTGAEYVRAAVK